MKTVAVINTGIANIASVLASVTRAGAKGFLTTNPDEVLEADLAVLPGVGAFKAGMAQLESLSLDVAVKERFSKRKPLLAVCLGLQLLFEESEESPGVCGLGIFKGKIQRFSVADRVPQLGWNLVEPEPQCKLLAPGYAYFANSFCLKSAPSEIAPAWCNYGEKFVAAFECNNLLACQFHPELSGKWGQSLVNAWIAQ